jgi:hypothetical protein
VGSLKGKQASKKKIGSSQKDFCCFSKSFEIIIQFFTNQALD